MTDVHIFLKSVKSTILVEYNYYNMRITKIVNNCPQLPTLDIYIL